MNSHYKEMKSHDRETDSHCRRTGSRNTMAGTLARIKAAALMLGLTLAMALPANAAEKESRFTSGDSTLNRVYRWLAEGTAPIAWKQGSATPQKLTVMRAAKEMAKNRSSLPQGTKSGMVTSEETLSFHAKKGTSVRPDLHVKRGTSVRPDHVLYPDSVFYGTNSATDNLLPLAVGIVPDSCRREVVRNLVATVMDCYNNRRWCGVADVEMLLRVLADNGFADVAYLLLTGDCYRAGDDSQNKGATTVAELVAGAQGAGGITPVSVRIRRKEIMMWCQEYLGGIRRPKESSECSRVELRPCFEIQDLDSVDAQLMTPRGIVRSAWKKDLQHLSWQVEIPEGMTAGVCLPDGSRKEVGAGRHSFSCAYSLADGRVEKDEFVYKQTDFPQCHAATIVELKNGDLVAAYFGGTKERNPDVCIWVNRKPKGSDKWSGPQLAADGVFALGTEQAAIAGIDTTCAKASTGPIIGYTSTWAQAKEAYSKELNAKDGSAGTQVVQRFGAPLSELYRKACWNPVLFEMPDGELWLFYKIGWVMNDWTGWVAKSRDGGLTWSEHEPLEKGFLGPVKNKPVISGDRLICPSSTENEGGWKFHFEILDLKTNKWKYVGPIERELWPLTADMKADGTLNDADPAKHQLQPIQCIQPSVLHLSGGRLQALGRTRNGRLASTWSSDNGDTWSKVTLIDAPNNQSGTDALTATDGQHVLIYNNFATIPGTPKGPRNPLSVATSADGLSWSHQVTLEGSPIGDYSYPAIIEGSDGSLHCIYTWRRYRIAYKELKLNK